MHIIRKLKPKYEPFITHNRGTLRAKLLGSLQASLATAWNWSIAGSPLTSESHFFEVSTPQSSAWMAFQGARLSVSFLGNLLWA